MTDGARLDHTGLSVGDLERMATWYAEVFGFTREITLRVELPEGNLVELLDRALTARRSPETLAVRD